jgi:hypothetical protein
MDLRAAIGAVARLPLPPRRLVDILREAEPDAADHPDHEDHTTFWLIVADQFARRGIDAPDARQRALAIIDAGDDLTMKARLGMTAAGLRRRETVLAELRARLAAPPAPKDRPVLKRPQPLLVDIGDVLAFPTAAGRPINPYYPNRDSQTFAQDAWGTLVIVDRGLTFEYLAWYRPLVFTETRPDVPPLESLGAPVLWRLGSPGPLSASHLKKMEMRRLGRVPIDRDRLTTAFGELKPGRYQAIHDISLANAMRVAAAAAPSFTTRPRPPLGARDQILAG